MAAPLVRFLEVALQSRPADCDGAQGSRTNAARRAEQALVDLIVSGLADDESSSGTLPSAVARFAEHVATTTGDGRDELESVFCRAERQVLRVLPIGIEATRCDLNRSQLLRLLEVPRLIEQTLSSLLALAAEEFEHARARAQDPWVLAPRTRVQQALAGDVRAASELGISDDAAYLAFVCSSGSAVIGAELRRRLGRALLVAAGSAEQIWGWLCGDESELAEYQSTVEDCLRSAAVTVGFGLVREGRHGFALTHREAAETYRASLAARMPALRFAEAAVLIALTRDSALLGTFLTHEVGALDDAGGDSDLGLFARTYLETAQNAAATAHRLGCSRRTVERKLARVETLLGYPLRDRPAELLLALRLSPSS